MVTFTGRGRPSGAARSARTTTTSLLLVLCLAVQSCSAAMAAWLTTIAPQIIRQNTTTGGITYSHCNSNNTPVFPLDPPNLLSLAFEPRNGTALTGKGWWDTRKTAASIFYQAKDGSLVNSYHECNPKTGKFNKINDRVISEGAPEPHSTTGLASVLLNEKEGYRVYYHDTNKTIQSIGYDPKNNNFYYAGIVSQDTTTGFALSAEFNSVRNISVVYPRDSENVGISRINSDGRFWVASAPRPLEANITTNLTSPSNITLNAKSAINFTLPSWTGQPKSMGISINSVTTRSIFWIGTDRILHQILNINWVWRPATNQTADLWPLADEPEAEFALASDKASSVVRIYYDVNKILTEIKFDTDGLWKPAQALPQVNLTTPGPTTSPDGTHPADAGPNSAPTDVASPGGQLSIGAKAGIGVGVAVGVLAAISAVLVVCLMRRRQRGLAAAEAEARASAEDEKRQQDAAASAHQHQQQQYYYNGAGSDAGATYPHSYGSPPPLTPFTDGGSAYGGAGAGYDSKSMGGGGSPQPPPPQELHSAAARYELPDQRATPHELPEQRQTLEMEGTAPESQGLMQNTGDQRS